MTIVGSSGGRVPRLDGAGEGSPATEEEESEERATPSQESEEAAFSGEEEEGDGEEEEEEGEEDSGMGSDELDISELGEAGAEMCQVGNQSCAVPLELYDLPGLGGVLSLDAWNSLLSEEERLRLAEFLPDMEQETFARTLVELFNGENLHFGSPLSGLFDQLKGGLCDPRIVLYRRGVNFAQRRKHYHQLRRYHNSMVGRLLQIKECWKGCPGYSLEEKLRVLDVMKTQQGLRDAGSETDSESRELGERSVRLKQEKMGRSSDYLVQKNAAKFGKEKSKGLLRLAVPKGAPQDYSGGAGNDTASKARAAVTLSELSRPDRVASFDLGVAHRAKHQRFTGGHDPEELGYDMVYADQRPQLKLGKRKDLPVSYDRDIYGNDYHDSRASSPHYGGKKASADQAVTLASYNPQYLETAKKAKYSERDWMYGGKGVPSKALKRNQMDRRAVGLTDNSDDLHRGDTAGDYRSGKAKSAYSSKMKSYKSIEQQINDTSLGADHRGKILHGNNRSKSSHYDIMGLKFSRGDAIYAQSEETESDSSEQLEDSGDVNPLEQQQELHHPGFHGPSHDAKMSMKLMRAAQKEYPAAAADFEPYQTKGVHKGKVREPGYLRDVHVKMEEQISEMMRPSAVRSEKRRRGMADLDMHRYVSSELHDSNDSMNGTLRPLESERLVSRSGYGAQASNGDVGGTERMKVPLSGCSSVTKKQKGKAEVTEPDGYGDYLPSGPKLQMENSGSAKKKGKRKTDAIADPSTAAPAPVLPESVKVDVEPEKPLKKAYVLITPTIHTGFSFSIIHLLSAVRKAMVSPTEDASAVGKHLDGEDGRTKLNNGEQNKMLQGLSGTEQSQQPREIRNASTGEQTAPSNLPALTVQELVNRVRSNPGDPCILETQEPLQDLIRGVLKIFSSKTAPLGAKSWKPLVSYDKSNKSWFWVGPLASNSSDNEPIEEETSAEAWGIPHKMLVKLVDAFANWLKSGQETLKQIGSLPPPPLPNPANLDLKERFKDLRAQKSLNTISPSSDESRAYFQREEFLRYSIPDRAFSYTAVDGEKSIVAPLRRGGGKPTAKAREHAMLLPDRPPHVTILCLVRDAAARLPSKTGTRADVCTLLRDSQYVNQDKASNDAFINSVVSGALDRLHYERDPCVLYDNDKKLWTYLHRGREEEDFEDDGTSSTKKWKRPRKDPADHVEPPANDDLVDDGTPSTKKVKRLRKDPTDLAGSGPANNVNDTATQDPSAGALSGGQLGENIVPLAVKCEGMSQTVHTDARSDIGGVRVSTAVTSGIRAEGNAASWQALPKQDNDMVFPQKPPNEDFDAEALPRERSTGLLTTTLL